MAQIGYGYGSEYQLLRFLGHHRNLLERLISESIGKGEFHWLDFEFEKDPMSSISGDKERKGLTFIKDLHPAEYEAIKREYEKEYRLGKFGSWQSWDAVFEHNETVYLVEAKAHSSELSSGNKNGGKSHDKILSFFKSFFPYASDAWLSNYYQLANRLAITAFLNKNNVKAKVLYIYFVNGYRKRIVEKVEGKEKICESYNLNSSRDDFNAAIESELKALGIEDQDISNLMATPVFIDAEYDYKKLKKYRDCFK